MRIIEKQYLIEEFLVVNNINYEDIISKELIELNNNNYLLIIKMYKKLDNEYVLFTIEEKVFVFNKDLVILHSNQ
jgi:hypothetical protein